MLSIDTCDIIVCMNKVEGTPVAELTPQGQTGLALPSHLAEAKQALFATYDAHIEQGFYIPPISGELKLREHMGVFKAGSLVVRKALKPDVSLESYVDGMVGGIGKDEGLEQLVMAHRNNKTKNVDLVYSRFMDGIPGHLVRTKDIIHYGHNELRTTLGTLGIMEELTIDEGPVNLRFQPDRIGIIDYGRGYQSLATKVGYIASGIYHGGILALAMREASEDRGEQAGRLPVLEKLLEVADEVERQDSAWLGSADAVNFYVKLINDTTNQEAPWPADKPVEPFEW